MGLGHVFCIYVMAVSLVIFMGILTARTGVSLIFCLLGRSLCYYLVTLSSSDRNTWALSYCILSFPIWLLAFGGLLFSGEEEGEEWILWREDVGFLGGVEWTETVDGMYCIRKKNLFSIKKSRKGKRKKWQTSLDTNYFSHNLSRKVRNCEWKRQG